MLGHGKTANRRLKLANYFVLFAVILRNKLYKNKVLTGQIK